MWMNMTGLGVVSVVLIALWGILLCRGKERVFALFALAHGLLYIDCFVLQNHFNFEVALILLAVSAVVAVIKWVQQKKVQLSKELAMYILISAVPLVLYILVLDISFLAIEH